MDNGREALHAALAAVLAPVTDCVIERNTDTPTDWETTEPTRKIIVRDGGFTINGRVGHRQWRHFPVLEGHVRADAAAELGPASDALLTAVLAILDTNPTLGGVVEDIVDLTIEDDPEINIEPDKGSMMGWRLKLTVEFEETTDS